VLFTPVSAEVLATEVEHFEAFKVVVLRDKSMTQTLMDMIANKQTSQPPPAMQVASSWKSGSVTGVTTKNPCFAVTEVPAQSVSLGRELL
jgi:hypothetical protein